MKNVDQSLSLTLITLYTLPKISKLFIENIVTGFQIIYN